MGGEGCRIYAEAGSWAWHCDYCYTAKRGFGDASTAAEGRDNHAALCPVAGHPKE